MPKKIVITEGVVDSILRLFNTAVATGKTDKVQADLERMNPKIADMWKELDDDYIEGMRRRRALILKYGGDTTLTDKFIANYEKDLKAGKRLSKL